MQNPKIRQSYLTLVLIWFVLVFSQAMFLAVIYFNKPEVFLREGDFPILGDNPLFTVLFAFLALIDLAIALAIRRRGARQAKEENNPRYLQTSLVVGCALCEAISLLGTFLAFAFSYKYFFAWFALGFLGLLLQFPRKSEVRAAILKG